MTGIVIVSHSWKIAEGVRDLALEMAAGYDDKIIASLENFDLINGLQFCDLQRIKKANDGDGVVLLADLGSGIMSAETAIELLDGEGIDVKLADAPIVEGAVCAAVEAVGGGDLEAVLNAAESARGESKL